MDSITQALKEWAVAVDALESGHTILLLRKGGIREEGGKFRVAHDRVLLYPTYEHQKPHLLKPAYAQQVQPVDSGWHPTEVKIGGWADITDIYAVSDAEAIAQLQPFHIWNEALVSDRFNWKPRQPLYVLLLRAYRLPSPHLIPYQAEYGGCQSWIELATPISLSGSQPVLSHQEYQQQVAAIQTKIGNNGFKKVTIHS
jgi:hypothetical protein